MAASGLLCIPTIELYLPLALIIVPIPTRDVQDFVSTFGREELRGAVERVDYNERFASLVTEVETRDRHRRAKAAAQRQHKQRASNASSVGSASFSSALREEEEDDEDGDGQSRYIHPQLHNHASTFGVQVIVWLYF